MLNFLLQKGIWCNSGEKKSVSIYCLVLYRQCCLLHSAPVAEFWWNVTFFLSKAGITTRCYSMSCSYPHCWASSSFVASCFLQTPQKCPSKSLCMQEPNRIKVRLYKTVEKEKFSLGNPTLSKLIAFLIYEISLKFYVNLPWPHLNRFVKFSVHLEFYWAVSRQYFINLSQLDKLSIIKSLHEVKKPPQSCL